MFKRVKTIINDYKMKKKMNNFKICISTDGRHVATVRPVDGLPTS